MALSIRPVRPGDGERVRELHAVALRDAGTDPDAPPDLSDLDDPAGHYADGAFLVGEIDGRIVAMGGFEPLDGETVELKRMRVDPDHQGRGHGRAILEALEERARDRGFGRAVLETAERQDAVPFYRAQGYEEVGRREWEGFELVRLETEL